MPRLGTWSRPRPPVSKILTQHGFLGMRTSLHEDTDPQYAHYLLNCHPRTTEHPSPVSDRAGRTVLQNTQHGAVVYLGQFRTLAGTLITLKVTTANGIYTYDWTLGTWTQVVTAANLATGSVTNAATTVGGVSFAGKIVFTSATGQPWMWDGTAGALGLTVLTNAPANTYGKPTVYYAKLFFIDAADRTTITWSEEGSPNTGYSAGGFSNVWALRQTGSSPLTAILGTNDGLYYFRRASIGVIRGAVNSDFATSGVHDAISTGIGTEAYHAVLFTGADIWFVDVQQRPHYIPAGGTPVCVMPYVEDQFGEREADGFGLGDVPWDRLTTSGTSAHPRATFVPATQDAWRAKVYVTVPTFHNAIGDIAGAALVFDADTHRCMGWQTYPLANVNGAGSIGNLTTLQNGQYDDIAVMAHTDPSGYSYACYGTVGGGDAVGGSSATLPTVRVVGPPLGVNDRIRWRFAEIQGVMMRAPGGATPLNVRAFTSERSRSDTISAALTVTGTAGGTGAIVERPFRAGIAESGRWIRPYFSWTAAGGTGIVSYAVLAYPDGQAVEAA